MVGESKFTYHLSQLDEMHSYIENKKTIIEYELLLIDLKKGSSTSLLGTEVTNQHLSFGIKLKATK